MVLEFEPRVGVFADSSESGACFGICVSLSLPLLAHALSLPQKEINVKKKRLILESVKFRTWHFPAILNA